MARARGANAKAVAAFEVTPGTTPAGGANWFGIPFVSHTLGEERPLIESDLLGQGREQTDPTPDVATNDGDIVVPVDVRNFGRWLKLFLGAPTTEGDDDDGYTHTFTSGAVNLPSMSIEIGAPEIPAYSVHYGARGNQLQIQQQRSGLLNATCSLICIGESDPGNATVSGGTAVALDVTRFPQAVGYVKKDGVQLGGVVGSTFSLSNNLEKVETIKADGRIEDSDPGQVTASGTATIRFADLTLLNAATAQPPTPIELAIGWNFGLFSLVFTMPRVFLPKPKRPISGPQGIQAQFNWQASGADEHVLTAVLSNDVASYA